MLLGALAKGTEPDRMKGALYILWNKGISMFFLLSGCDVCSKQPFPQLLMRLQVGGDATWFADIH